MIKAYAEDVDHFSTYYKKEFLWDKGYVFQINSDTIIDTLVLDMLALSPLNGSHTNSGKVTNDQDIPRPGVPFILATSEGTPMGHIYSDNLGEYEFNSVPAGSYNIMIDTLGVYMQTWYTIEITDLKSAYDESFS